MKHQQTLIRFTKMHGLGNDFVIINTLNQAFDITQLPIARLANRHIGIGFDQLLLIESSHQADFFCRIFNADGSEAEQCGNGLRCLARFIQEEDLHQSELLSLETKAGIFPVVIKDYDHICVTMGAPHIEYPLTEINILDPAHSRGTTALDRIPMSILSLGNPHAIIKVDAIDKVQADQLGPEISKHAFFPNGTNVGFMQVINQHHIRLRTFERGAGETHACGSNACAAVCAGIANGWLKHQVDVEFIHGNLAIEWEGKNKPVHMTGPAVKVFSGEISLLNNRE